MILAELREATRVWHDRVEAHPRLARLLAADFTVEEYHRLLTCLYGFYEPLEARLAVHAAALPLSLAERAKAPLLRRDLRALGLSEAQLRAVPRCPAPPAFATPEAALGGLYVVEGATLGGAIIRRHLARSLALTPRSGGAFYAGYGARIGPMWQAFCGRLTAHVAEDASRQAVVQGACATFESFHEWLGR